MISGSLKIFLLMGGLMFLGIVMMISVILLGIGLLKMEQFKRVVMQKALANLGDKPATLKNIRLEIKKLRQSGDKETVRFDRTMWILSGLMAFMLLLAGVAMFQAA